MAVAYEDEAVGRACLEAGRELCLAAIYDRPYDVGEVIHKLRKVADDVRWGPSTRTVAEAALARDFRPPAHRRKPCSTRARGRQRRIHRSATDRTGAVAESISDDKEVTKAYLRSAGVPVPRGRMATSPADAWQAAQEIGGSVVVKPNISNYGTGVVVGISKREHIEAAYDYANRGSGVIVEQLVPGAGTSPPGSGWKARGRDAGQSCRGRRGRPPNRGPIDRIATEFGPSPRQGFFRPTGPVELYPTVLLVLEQQGYTIDSVPAAGAKVMVSEWKSGGRRDRRGASAGCTAGRIGRTCHRVGRGRHRRHRRGH